MPSLAGEDADHGEDKESAGLHATAISRGSLHRLLQVRRGGGGFNTRSGERFSFQFSYFIPLSKIFLIRTTSPPLYLPFFISIFPLLLFFTLLYFHFLDW